MGKRSKRRHNRNTSDDGPPTPSSLISEEPMEHERDSDPNHPNHHHPRTQKSLRTPTSTLAAVPLAEEGEETAENLRFEDPFVDEYEEETPMEDNPDAAANTQSGASVTTRSTNGNETPTVEAWNPLTCDPLPAGTNLEIDETAYKMHHSLTPDWPSLSFTILRDSLGEQRTRFPHSVCLAVGSQADRTDRNRLTVLRLSCLSRTNPHKSEKELEDEMLGEEYDPDADSDDDSQDEEEEEEVDVDPVLEHYHFKHEGGVNRVRAMPQNQSIVATWSDTGTVNLYDVQGVLHRFQRSNDLASSSSSSHATSATHTPKIRTGPCFVYQGHSTEGYAMDWSRVTTGRLATGDCDGHIHLWDPTHSTTPPPSTTPYHSSSWKVRSAYASSALEPSQIDRPSIEDLQWSPTEATVLASGECAGYVKIYDTRCEGRPMIQRRVHENGADVNVISWNPLVGNLLASGGDDGTFSVWDLRNFQSSADTTPKPLARFTCHRQPITSLEWHPTDESTIVVTDEDGTYVYDLSVEEDEEEQEDEDGGGTKGDGGGEEIPPQLLFVHCGSQSTKEAHWHPQITSCLVTTALTGYSVFIPSNL